MLITNEAIEEAMLITKKNCGQLITRDGRRDRYHTLTELINPCFQAGGIEEEEDVIASPITGAGNVNSLKSSPIVGCVVFKRAVGVGTSVSGSGSFHPTAGSIRTCEQIVVF